MTDLVVLCADGSDLSTRALSAGLALLRSDVPAVVATVIEPADPMLVTGTGFAGGTMSPETFEQVDAEQVADGQRVVSEVADALGRPDAETVVLRGDAGTALCDLAEERGAAAIVIGTRGRGGFKRALLGSVSDIVVRNAPCPVIVSSPSEE